MGNCFFIVGDRMTEQYTDGFCISCKHLVMRDKYYCELTGEWRLTSQDKCNKWEK